MKLLTLFADFKKHFKQLFNLKKFAFVFIVIYLLPKKIFRLPGLGLDPSWKLSLNMAIAEDLVWGKDIVFTYGPLGYLETGLAFDSSKIAIILYSLFISINAIYFIYYLFKKLSSKNEILFIVTIFFFIGHFPFKMNAFSLYFYFLFHVFHYIKHNNRLSLVILSTCALLAFYIKVNTGIVMNILFVVFIIYNYQLRVRGILINTLHFVCHFFVLLLMSQVLNVEPIAYILNSFSIIDSYNDAMLNYPNKWKIFGGLLIISTICISLVKYLKIVFKDYYEMFLFSNVLLFVFITFKQSFVRADFWHTSFFFLSIPFIVILAYLYSNNLKIKNKLHYCIIVIPIISISFLEVNSFQFFRLYEEYQIISSSQKNQMSENIKSRKLPSKIVHEIGDKTVDVLGYETSFIFYNNLKYRPRPVFQSYQAYNSKLIDINYKRYNGKNAPDYVLYHLGSIDNRHPFWDEPKIYLSLFKNYRIFDTIPETDTFSRKLILFKKNKSEKKISEKVILDSIIQFDTEFTIPKSNKILYMKFDFEYSLKGKIRRFFYQPSLIYMNLSYADQTETNYRTVLPVMKSGVPINKKVIDGNDAYTFFNSEGRENLNASSFVLTADERWFKNPFSVKIIEYTIDNP